MPLTVTKLNDAPPLLVRDDVMFGTAQLPKFEADLFKLTDERGLYLTQPILSS